MSFVRMFVVLKHSLADPFSASRAVLVASTRAFQDRRGWTLSKMDPVSAVATVLSIADVALRTISTLISYAHDSKHATADRELLVEEAISLKTLLEQLRDHAKNTKIAGQWIQCRKGLIQQFQKAYEDFASLIKLDDSTNQLKQESRFKALRTKTKWTFTKVEVYSLLERMTRLQQHANALLLNDQQ